MNPFRQLDLLRAETAALELPTVDVSRLDIRKMGVQVMHNEGEIAVRVVLGVRDVTPAHLAGPEGIPIETQSDYSYDPYEISQHRDPRALAQLIRRQCLAALEHELDECLLVNGARVVEPHPKGPK